MSSVLSEGTGILVGVGVGAAASAALEPAVEIPKQEAWARNANRILDVGLLARLVAQGAVALGAAHDEALRDGYGPDKLDALVYLSQTVPGISEAIVLWRLGLLSDPLFGHVLTKTGLDQRYVDPIVRSKTAIPISPADVATMVQRTILPNPGILPNQPATTGSNVPPMPTVDRDPYEEAAKSGVPPYVLDGLARIVGLPASPDLAARMHFRKIITEGAYNQAILEGNTRGEWAPFLLDGFREILTVGEYVEAHLRGWTDEPTMYANTAKHGMSRADTLLRFQTAGRPISTHQITTGLARGGTYPSTYDDVPEPYQKAIRESNIRPEWALLDYANRYTYPSGFQIRAEAQKGDLTFAETEQLLLEVGWSPKWAAFFAEKWTGGTAAVSDPHVTKAQNQLWTTTHSSYKAGEIDDAAATTALGAAGVGAAAVPAVLDVWRTERALVRHGLTVANIHKAYSKQDLNDATGQPWTRDEAIAELVRLGYNPAEAGQYLDIV